MLRQYFCSRVDGLIPAASRRILFKHPWCLLTSVLVFESHLRRILLTRPWCLFRARPAFVLVCEDHLDFLPKCSRGILFVSFLGVEPFVTRREILWCLFRARPAFVLVCEDHLCHETEVLYEALVSMFRVCIGLRLSHTSAAGPDWRLRSSYTEQV